MKKDLAAETIGCRGDEATCGVGENLDRVERRLAKMLESDWERVDAQVRVSQYNQEFGEAP